MRGCPTRRFGLTHILLCLLFSIFLANVSLAAKNGQASVTTLSAPYQKWLDEDARYLITDEEREEFAKLKSDDQRDRFIENFWERRNPNPGSKPNKFKEEHYRRLAYANQHFVDGVPGYKTDRGHIYILYGPPDEREQHPGRSDIGIPASAPLTERYPSDVWRYHSLKGVGRDVFFKFIDTCRCGEFQLRNDPTKETPNTN